MAAFTSKAAGNWSASGQTTWTQVGVPTANDTVTISHAIAVDVNTSVGLTAFTTGGTAAITMSGGSLTVNAGVTLTVSGDINHTGDSPVTLAAGSVFSFKPPSGQQCVWNQSTNTNSAITANGSSGSHATIQTDKSLGGLSSKMTTGSFRNQGVITATYLDVIDMGTTAAFGIISQVDFNNNANVSLTDGTFTRSNYKFISPGGNAWDGSLTFSRNLFSSSVLFTGNAVCALFSFQATATTGVRTISGNAFDKLVELAKCYKCTFQYNSFGAYFLHSGTWTVEWLSFDSNLVYIPTGSPGGITAGGGPMTNCFWHCGDAAATNQHMALFNPPSTSTSINWTGNLFGFDGSNTAGNCVITSDTGSVCTFNFKNNISLPNASGTNTGALLATAGNATHIRMTVEHNTCQVDGQWMLEVGDTQTVVESPNRWTSAKANLAYGTATTGYMLINDDSITNLQDIVPPSVMDYNGKYLVKLTSGIAGFTNEGRGYASKWSATPGPNDITANPQFVDGTRTFPTWGVTQGQGSSAATLAYIATNPTTYIPQLIAWVRAGYVPQNATYQAASYPGDTSTTDAAGNSWPGGAPGIGAMAFQSSTAAGCSYQDGSVFRPMTLPLSVFAIQGKYD